MPEKTHALKYWYVLVPDDASKRVIEMFPARGQLSGAMVKPDFALYLEQAIADGN